ncbi:MAG: RecQ family ATP-dependent DNA helicase [Deltaproteobacteria bacterium]|nr:RecQ family ATP-dependent DNA helicase [Deltaproteobacteria bacterium]
MSSDLRRHARSLLRHALNDPLSDFYPDQWEAIEHIITRKSRLLVVQRTGWGKSLVYFLATRLLRDGGIGPTLLISPLLALMRNQIMMAERLSVSAATINSSNPDEWKDVEARLRADVVDILLISPERLANDEFRQKALLPIAGRIGCFVVDEAHCISDWGHDFRPDYRRIVRVLEALPKNIPVLATTATANDRVIKDIVEQLGNDLKVLRGPLGRSSLRLQNISLPSQASRMAWLAEHLPSLPGSGIIYTLTVSDAQRLAEWLQTQNIDAHGYWGGLAAETRVNLENQLLNNEIKALVATTALGMGLDKPDLGFVIHFQRPGSVVHYYQQVGRAGRAIDQAYCILLSGDEDREITDYFIRTAFPPEGDALRVLSALDQADSALSVPMLEEKINLPRSRIEKVLSLLAVLTPAPVSKQKSKWSRNPVPYVPDTERIELLTKIRRAEQFQMQEYAHTQDCLMAFLQKSLDDPKPTACGRCASCLKKPLITSNYSIGMENRAIQFLRRCAIVIEPRKQWPWDALSDAYGWRGNIPAHLRTEEGRALCLWGDAGWGEMVRRGKQQDVRFDQKLVVAAAEMLRSSRRLKPFPKWVTCVPSTGNPVLVPDFAERLARELNRPFVPCIEKVRRTHPQKEMNNSYQQAGNLAGAFKVNYWKGMEGPVLLVDDMVDSRWTFTIIAALLRTAGSGIVFPFALAMTTTD